MRLSHLAALAALAAAPSVSAQPFNWALPTNGSTISLSAERPLLSEDFAGDNGLSAGSSAWLFSTTQALGPARLVGEIPFAFGSVDGADDDGAALGNVQVGAEIDLVAAPVRLGGYLRLPTASGANGVAGFVGTFADVERIGLYTESVVTVSALVEARPSPISAPGLSFRLRAIPQLLILTDTDASDDSVEGVLGYAAQAFYSVGLARVGGGLSGASILTEDVGDNRHAVSIGVLADVLAGPVRIGATVRLPVAGESNDFVDAVVGLRVSYGIF